MYKGQWGHGRAGASWRAWTVAYSQSHPEKGAGGLPLSTARHPGLPHAAFRLR